MANLAMTAGIIAGIFLSTQVFKTPAIQFFSGKGPGTTVQGSVIARDSTSLTILTSGGQRVKFETNSQTIWHSLELRRTASTTIVRAIGKTTEPEMFVPGTQGRFAYSENTSKLQLRRAVALD